MSTTHALLLAIEDLLQEEVLVTRALLIERGEFDKELRKAGETPLQFMRRIRATHGAHSIEWLKDDGTSAFDHSYDTPSEECVSARWFSVLQGLVNLENRIREYIYAEAGNR